MLNDFKESSVKARLYLVLRAIADAHPQKGVLDLLDEAMGRPLNRGTDYLSNVRKGRFSTSIAKQLYGWLKENHFELGQVHAPELFTGTAEGRWRVLLDKRARVDRISLVLVRQTMGIVERESQLKQADTTIRLGQRFCFELESEDDGFVIALQGVRGQWHNIPLGSNGEVNAPIHSGQNRLPKRSDGRLDPLTENHDEGMHEFVLIQAPTKDIPLDLKKLVSWTAENQCELHRARVQVIK